MRILLLGGNGFIGEYLTKKVNNRKDCEIIVIYNRKLLKNKSDRITYVKLDLTKPSKTLEKLVNAVDVVVILTQPNIKIIDNLISAIKLKSYLKKIVYLSSTLVYDNFTGKQDEKFTTNPITDYEKGKYAEELKLSKFVKEKNLKLCITRLANVYGDIKNKGLINYIFLAILNNGKITINGKGDSIRDYIFVEDVVAYLDFLIFWDQKNKKEIFNICTEKGSSVVEVVSAAEKIVGSESKKVFGPEINEKKMIIGDNKKILNLSKIKLKYDLTKGLRKTYKNYLKWDLYRTTLTN